jgi:hypothetical protein
MFSDYYEIDNTLLSADYIAVLFSSRIITVWKAGPGYKTEF